jgi:hypothetical protein
MVSISTMDPSVGDHRRFFEAFSGDRLEKAIEMCVRIGPGDATLHDVKIISEGTLVEPPCLRW